MASLFYLFTLLALVIAIPIPSFPLLPPNLDPFYRAPSNLDSLSNGEVYDKRAVFDSVWVDATLAKVEQIAYKTLNTQNESSHSVATIFSPQNPASDVRILSYQVYEDAANLECAPSYALATEIFGDLPDITVSILTALNKGWYVIVPDHEGPRSAFMAGHEQGQAGLDGIRAGISYLGVDKQTPIALLGYSGGASATTWMESLHGAYAPELNIVGSAHGGTPLDIFAMLNFLDKDDNLFSGFIVPAFAGLFSAYPDMEKNYGSYLHPELANAIKSTREPGICILQNVVEFEHHNWHEMIDTDVFTNPISVEMFKNESLLSNVSSTTVPVPTFPRYIWHAVGDEIIPIGPVNQYVEEQCSQGANIQYVQWQGDDHLTTEYLGLPDALKFVIQALEGTTPNVQCGQANNDILTIVSHDLIDWVGQPVADIITTFGTLSTPLGRVIADVTHGYRPF